MRYRMKIYPWQNGQGWQAHDIADREANTLKGLFNQLNALCFCDEEALKETDRDYSLDIYDGNKMLVSSWLSVYLQNGITIDTITYSAE